MTETLKKTDHKHRDLKTGSIFLNMYSSHLTTFRTDYSAFQNWRDSFKRNSDRALDGLKTGDLWRPRIRYGISENTILPGNVSKRDEKLLDEIETPPLGHCLPAFAPVFAGLMQRRRRRENRPRRQRTTFSSDQTVKLEIEYSRTEYITRSRRYELAEMLSLTENQIKIWFQNRRAKEKRIEKAQMDHHIRSLGIARQSGNYPFPRCPSGDDDLCETNSWPEGPPIQK